MKIGEFFQGLFSKLARIAKFFIEQAFPVAGQIILGQLTDFAKQAVEKLNNTDLNNDERRNKAFEMIKSYAINNSIEARDSLIHAAIALAVLSFKKEF